MMRLLSTAIPLFFATSIHAGPYAPAADQPGSTAIAMDDPTIAAWASAVSAYQPGTNVETIWQDTSNALGAAEGIPAEGVVSLGRGGSITLSFPRPIADGPGADFAVFENAIRSSSAANGWFLELAYVEVSADGYTWFRFPNRSLTSSPVGGFGGLDPTDIEGLAGKYGAGWGAPFDLADLAFDGAIPIPPSMRYVRLVDIVGDGRATDTTGAVIYDPFPTLLSAGFDLDAVAVLHEVQPAEPNLRVEAPPGLVRVTWQESDGYTYRLEQSSDGKTWTSLTGNLQGLGGPRTLDLPAPDAPTFYRVVIR